MNDCGKGDWKSKSYSDINGGLMQVWSDDVDFDVLTFSIKSPNRNLSFPALPRAARTDIHSLLISNNKIWKHPSD